jgi:hypothetical protein
MVMSRKALLAIVLAAASAFMYASVFYVITH